jgi:hypothetical protein
MAPASWRAWTAGAWTSGWRLKEGQAHVVGKPATSMLSLTANGMPQSGPLESGGWDSRNLERD